MGKLVKHKSFLETDVIDKTDSQKLISSFFKLVLDQFVWLLVLVILLFALITTPEFFSSANIMNLFVQSAVLALLVLAESICLITGYFDLSIESILVFSAVVAAWFITPHAAASGLNLSPVLGIFIFLLIGVAIGSINGLFVAYLKMNAFITTLAMSIILVGGCVAIGRGNTLGPFPSLIRFFGSGKIGPIPTQLVILLLMYILFHIIFTKTSYGRKLFAVGGNPKTAHASGINVKRIVFSAYVLSGAISAVAGLILSGRMGSAISTMTKDNLLFAFAGAVIGGVNPFGGQGRIINIFGGVVLLMIINKLLIIARVDPFILKGTSGLIIFVALIILTLKEKIFIDGN